MIIYEVTLKHLDYNTALAGRSWTFASEKDAQKMSNLLTDHFSDNLVDDSGCGVEILLGPDKVKDKGVDVVNLFNEFIS